MIQTTTKVPPPASSEKALALMHINGSQCSFPFPLTTCIETPKGHAGIELSPPPWSLQLFLSHRKLKRLENETAPPYSCVVKKHWKGVVHSHKLSRVVCSRQPMGIPVITPILALTQPMVKHWARNSSARRIVSYLGLLGCWGMTGTTTLSSWISQPQ